MNYDASAAFRKHMRNPWKVRAFLLFKLPLALFAGLRIARLDAQSCTVTVPHGWRSTNPFKSTYFAALVMAAELSTGALVMAELRAHPLKTGMLVRHMQAEFGKRATDVVAFSCEGGEQVRDAVQEAVRTGAAVRVALHSVGRMPDGIEVARFEFTWSIVARAS